MPHKDKATRNAYLREHADAIRAKQRIRSRRFYERHKDALLEWQHTNRRLYGERYKQTHLKNRYGLNAKEYNFFFDLQDGKCAICGRHQSEFKQRLCVDHDHATGIVRGLLCRKCNAALGLLGDDVALMVSAVGYLAGEE